MADAVLKRWRERCNAVLERPAYAAWQLLSLDERGGLIKAVDSEFLADPGKDPVDVLRALVALSDGRDAVGHTNGLRLALSWLREEMEREDG